MSELGAHLAARDIRAEIYVVGGAAMALAYDRSRLTRDIDAVYVPKSQVYDEAEKMAGEHGLPSGWLNDAAKGFVPPGLDHASILCEGRRRWRCALRHRSTCWP